MHNVTDQCFISPATIEGVYPSGHRYLHLWGTPFILLYFTLLDRGRASPYLG